ncbi:hypothetical protein BU24DRAFT_486372 [Aaosphaeria arxii CBS 175.79]|uniref:Cell surface protein n=1 Tax=Aaosphaeria arxii CBS 175.79 TaxID=1450172 RepID=A0A6A5XEH9_9PLEO|nr:uncharacterized protein BU24DRAFT_486372 [Aaosphaeria arxii CBS 175.79]KAF2011615.1 hypothetical protein BU24DRAFT_486372 [Aaosphaeria arxii CBS 175.79]
MHIPTTIPLLLFTLAPYVTAHGKVTHLTGSAGGNTTALGIIGGIVPNTGPNSETEVDTTVFKGGIKSDGLGKTEGGGENRVEDLWIARGLSDGGNGGVALVGKEDGWVEGVWHVVVTDGAGPLKAVIDTTASGSFSNGTEAEILLDIPGKNGNLNPDASIPRSLSLAALSTRTNHLLRRGAKTVNRDYTFRVAVAGDTKCEGKVAGLDGVCFMKIANENAAGPFGGVVAFQMVDGGTVNNGTRVVNGERVKCGNETMLVGQKRAVGKTFSA